MKAFDLADKYRNPAMVLGDGLLGQMMEPVEFKDIKTNVISKEDWALGSCRAGNPEKLFLLILILMS